MPDVTHLSDTPSTEPVFDPEFNLNPEAPCFESSTDWMRLFNDPYQFCQPLESSEQKIQRLENEILRAQKETEALRRDVDTLEQWIRKMYGFITIWPIRLSSENRGERAGYENQ